MDLGSEALGSLPSDALLSIAGRLGTEPDTIEDLAALDADKLWELDAAIAVALAQEEREIEAGIHHALEALPWLLRGPARAIVGRRGA